MTVIVGTMWIKIIQRIIEKYGRSPKNSPTDGDDGSSSRSSTSGTSSSNISSSSSSSTAIVIVIVIAIAIAIAILQVVIVISFKARNIRIDQSLRSFEDDRNR